MRFPAEIPQWGTGPIVQVAVHIRHNRRGDLRIDLVAPTGQAYRVKEANPQDTAADVVDVFDVRLGQSMQPGTWTLVVTDTVRGEKGYLGGWGLVY